MINDYRSIAEGFTLTYADLDRHLSVDHSPEALVEILDGQFSQLYRRDGGNWEGYTIGQHTVMVLHQFNRYYSFQPLPMAVSDQLFRLFLALHDIGKPIAIAIDSAGKSGQHRYTWELMSGFYRHLKIDGEFIDISHALLHGDLLGAYLRNRCSQTETETLIRQQAAGTVLSADEYFELLQVYYKVDAGSYTEDAGGKRSLDALFDFDHQTPQLRFAADVQRKIDRLSL